jgi:hypothetical protein
MTTQPGLIVDDDAVISAGLAELQTLLGKVNEVIEADRTTLRMVTKAEPLLDIRTADDGKRVVCLSTARTGLVVDPEWAGLS